MKSACLATILLLAAAALPAAAQESPAPTPETATVNKADPLGFGVLSKGRPKGSTTEITALKEATFDEKGNRAVFIGDVRVKDPAFLLKADQLTVFLTKDRSAIDRAVAEGNVVIVQQTSNSTEKGAVGRSSQATYVPATGVVTLTGWPEVQQGINRHMATEASTRMVLHSDGRATTEGASKTLITDTEKPPGTP